MISSVSSPEAQNSSVVQGALKITEISGFQIVEEDDNSSSDDVNMADRDENESYMGHEEQEETEEERTETASEFQEYEKPPSKKQNRTPGNKSLSQKLEADKTLFASQPDQVKGKETKKKETQKVITQYQNKDKKEEGKITKRVTRAKAKK